jgi:hypothetical protein
VSREQNAGQNYNIKTGNNSYETVELFKYLGRKKKEKKTLTNSNSIHEEMPNPVTELSKAWVCSRSPAGIAGSNPAEGTAVCLL